MFDKPNKIFFTYVFDEKGNAIPKDIFINTEHGFSKEEFDAEKHLTLIEEFLKDNNISTVQEAEEKGIFGRFDEKEITRETLEKFLGTETNEKEEELALTPTDKKTNEEEKEVATSTYGFDDDDEYKDEIKSDKTVLKRVGAGVLAAGAMVGMLSLLHSCNQEQITEQKEENADDLYKNMTEEQKAFFEPTFKAVEEFNAKTVKEGNFKLENDKTSLHITVDEAIALNVIMNDYTADELYNIFGTLEFDTNNVMNLARSAYSKLSTYYMNAKEASGLSQMINDEDARLFFERHENAVIEFNNNPSTDLSDNVIKGLYYDYVHGGSTGEYAKINNDGVAWMATSAGFGFELANRNVEEFLKISGVSQEEIDKYGDAAAAVGMPLSKITTSELLNGINEEIDLDIIDEINNKSLCAAVTTQTRDTVEALRMKQQIAVTIIKADAKGRLVEGLQNAGINGLAEKVMASDITMSQELLDEISEYGAVANNLVDDYNNRISSTTKTEAMVVAVMELAQEKFGLDTEIDLADLVNNRFRTKEKEKEEKPVIKPDTDGIPVVDKEVFENIPEDKKDDFIKENGVVIKEETTTKEEVVKEEDLTPEEKEDVVDQKAILSEIEQKKNDLITKGSNDAITYTEEKGAYNYSTKIVNPYNNETIDTDNLSLFNIVAHVKAFGSGAENINSNDNQIQERMGKDASKVASEIDSLSADAKEYLKNEYGSNWEEKFLEESYIYGYTTQINGSLKTAREMGDVLKTSAKEAAEKAQAEIDATKVPETAPETTPETVPETTPVVPETTPDTTPETEKDPNIGENFEEDEIPFVPSSPVTYISDEEWDLAFSDEPIEIEAPKTR